MQRHCDSADDHRRRERVPHRRQGHDAADQCDDRDSDDPGHGEAQIKPRAPRHLQWRRPDTENHRAENTDQTQRAGSCGIAECDQEQRETEQDGQPQNGEFRLLRLGLARRRR